MNATLLHSQVFDAIRDPLLLVDADGRVLLANPAARALFGFSEWCSLADLSCRDERLDIDARELAELVARPEPVRDFQLSTSGGPDAGVVVNVELLPGDPARRLKLVHVRGRAPDTRGDFWKDEMISMVSHELKNPLSAMKHSVDILLSQLPGELTAGQRRFLDASGRSIDRLTQMLEGYLDVSRIRSGSLEIERRMVDVAEFVGVTVESFRTLFNVHRVELDWHVEGNGFSAFVDRGKLEQVMFNLFSNALKFTPEGGRISVAARVAGLEGLDEERRLLPWHEIGHPRLLEILVTDTGLGMSSETLGGVFDRFGAPGSARDGAGRGAHLGLNISRALVEAMGGWLDINSQLGIGTTVTVRVPLDRRTQCVFSRLGRAAALLDGYGESRRRAVVLAVGKYRDDSWSDICRSWGCAPALNPSVEAGAHGRFHLWTLTSEMALAVLADPGEEDTIDRLVNPNFVECDDDCYVFNAWAIGTARVPSEAESATQAISVAMSRMARSRDAMAHSTIGAMRTGVEWFAEGENVPDP